MFIRRVRLLSMGCLLALMLAPELHADELSEVQRLYTAGDKASAMARADRYLSEHPQDPQMRFVKGTMLVDAGQSAEAITLFRKLISDFPDLAEPYNNLATVYAAEGNYDQARETLERALRANPSYATAEENLGDVYAALSARAYSRALQLDPKGSTAGAKLALVRGLYKRPQAGAVAPDAATATGSTAPVLPTLPSAAAPAAAASADTPASAPEPEPQPEPFNSPAPAPDPS